MDQLDKEQENSTGPDPAGSRTVPPIRLAPLKPLASVFWGEAPVLFTALTISGLLWGTGHDLASDKAGDGRAAVAWLAVVALVLPFSYPLLRLAARLMRGFWPQVRLGRALAEAAINRRRKRRSALIERASEERLAFKERRAGTDTPAAWAPPLNEEASPRVATYFTPVVRPTRLGDEEAALASRVERHYGLDLSYAWPRLVGLIPEPERGALVDAERGVDAAVYTAAGWLAAMAWLLAATIGFLGAHGSGSSVVPGWFTLAGAAGAFALYLDSYRRAVNRTISHGRLVESAVNLHRFSLLDALGWRRPKNAKEERRIFEALSAVLAYQADASRYWQYAAPGQSAAPLADARRALDAAVAQMPQVVSAGVLGQVERELRGVLHNVLAGPPPTNFNGHLSVTLMAGEALLHAGDGGVFAVSREREYELVISIGQRAIDEAETVPVVIRGGDDNPEVPFSISIDSNVVALRIEEQPLTVSQDSYAGLTFPLCVPPDSAEVIWLWIRVAQHNRTIQSLEITLTTAGG